MVKNVKAPITDGTFNTINYNFNSLSESHRRIQTQLNDLVLDAGKSDQEVAQARGGHQVLADRLNSVDSQLAQAEENLIGEINNLEATKASREELQNKVSHGENESITWGMIEQNAKENISGDKVAVVGRDSVNTTNLVDGSATFRKRTRLGDLAKITLGITGELPNIDTKRNVLEINGSFYVVYGSQYTYFSEGVSIDYSEARSYTRSIAFFFDTVNEYFFARRQNHIDDVPENCVLFATIAHDENNYIKSVDISVDYTVDGLTRFNSSVYALVTPAQNTSLPIFNENTFELVFDGNFNIIYNDKYYYIEGPKVFNFGDEGLTSAGRILYYDQANGEFVILNQGDSPGHGYILIAMWYSYKGGFGLEMNCNYTVDGSSNQESSVNYMFTPEELKGEFPTSNFSGVGEEGNPFNYTDDNHELVYSLFDELMAKNPDYISKEELGTSEKGKPINLYKFTPKKPEFTVSKPYPKVIIGGAIHGRENLAVNTIYHIFERICRDWQDDKALEYLRHNINFLVVPVQNPDDYDGKFYNGEKEEGINLNSDFDWQWSSRDNNGEQPFTRKESQILRDFLFENSDAMHHIDCHVRGGRREIEDSDILWLSLSEEKQTFFGTSTISQLSRRFKKEYPQLPDLPFYGHGRVSSGSRNIRGYSQFVAGIDASTWEGFSASRTMNEVENSEVVNMNVVFLGQYLIDIIKYYKTNGQK